MSRLKKFAEKSKAQPEQAESQVNLDKSDQLAREVIQETIAKVGQKAGLDIGWRHAVAVCLGVCLIWEVAGRALAKLIWPEVDLGPSFLKEIITILVSFMGL